MSELGLRNWCKTGFWALVMLLTMPFGFKYLVLGLRIWLMHELECPACGHVIDPVGYWHCTCGFDTPHERHVLEPCRKCGKMFKWIQCPACEMSIPI